MPPTHVHFSEDEGEAGSSGVFEQYTHGCITLHT